MSDLYEAVKRGIEASMQVRGRYEAGFIDRPTAIRHLSEIGLLTTDEKATLFLDRMDKITHPRPWWKFWSKPEFTIVMSKDHPEYEET